MKMQARWGIPVAVVVGAAAMLSLEAPARSDGPSCSQGISQGWSHTHSGAPGVPGAFTTVSIYADGSGGVGLLTTGCTSSTSCTVVPALLARRGDALKNFDVTIPGQPDGTNGQPWTGMLRLGFDDDDDVAIAKLVQLSAYTGQNSQCGNLWYVMSSYGAAACIANSDCGKLALPAPTYGYVCSANTCVDQAPAAPAPPPGAPAAPPAGAPAAPAAPAPAAPPAAG
jgi:hypothetical protein